MSEKIKLTRGLRNNNCLNIRISSDNFLGEIKPSTDKAFKQFKTAAYGYRAAFKILSTYIDKYGLNTIEKMIGRWAPENENNTEGYISTVCSRSHIDRDEIISSDNKDQMVPIVAAMSYVENGIPAEMEDVEDGWKLLNFD